jgi:phosphoribosyl 1,2-cyclic phosphodiesterase
MILHCIGSSSKGNCYILSNEKEALIIEAGLPLMEVKKALDFNISKIVGVIVSHEHGDHAGHVKEFMSARIPVCMSLKTAEKLGILPEVIISGIRFSLGNFTVLPFNVKHDAAEPLGFLISHPEIGVLLFATDTYYLPYKFDGLTNILIECNYRLDILEKNIAAGRIPAALRDRTLQSHMSFDTCKEALLANDLRKVNNIVLIHLSDGNSNADEFQKDIHQATGKTVYVADKGLKISLNKTPF